MEVSPYFCRGGGPADDPSVGERIAALVAGLGVDAEEARGLLEAAGGDVEAAREAYLAGAVREAQQAAGALQGRLRGLEDEAEALQAAHGSFVEQQRRYLVLHDTIHALEVSGGGANGGEGVEAAADTPSSRISHIIPHCPSLQNHIGALAHDVEATRAVHRQADERVAAARAKVAQRTGEAEELKKCVRVSVVACIRCAMELCCSGLHAFTPSRLSLTLPPAAARRTHAALGASLKAKAGEIRAAMAAASDEEASIERMKARPGGGG